MIKKIASRHFLRDIKGGLPDIELMRKYDVSASELCLLLLQAADMGLINLSDFAGKKTQAPVQLEDSRAVPRINIESDLSIRVFQEGTQGTILDISERGFQAKGLVVRSSETKDIEILANCYSPPYKIDVRAKCCWVDIADDPQDWKAGFEVISVEKGNLKHLCKYLASTGNLGCVGSIDAGVPREVNCADYSTISVSDNLAFGESDCQSNAMRELLEQTRAVAQSDSIVLLSGETGSGKDYFAKFIHRYSKRAAAPYVVFNCSAIPLDLAESELFGHEAGAFTGADVRKKGMLALAPGGTLLLNEIGELSLEIQAKLLTFLDTKCFRPVGGLSDVRIDTRIIAATNRNLQDEVDKGMFRKDLFYRLNVVFLEVPPLRERIEDLQCLIKILVAEIAREWGLQRMILVDKKTLALLEAYEWPGNIRELRNRLERSLILSKGRQISFSLMFEAGREDKWPLNLQFSSGKNFNEFIQEVRRRVVSEALARSQGSRQTAAKILGITRYSLKRHMTNLGLMHS